MAYRNQTFWDTIYAVAAPFVASIPAGLHVWTHTAGSDWRRSLFEHKEKRIDVYNDENGRRVLSYLASMQAKLVAESEFERAKVLHTLQGRIDRPFERVNVFITNDYAIHRAGAFTLHGNVNIGLPASFTAKKLEHADVDAFLRRFYPDFAFLETRSALLDETVLSNADMERLRNALFLSQNARTYVLFRELLYAKKWRLHFDAFMGFAALTVPIILCKGLHDRLRHFIGARRGGRLLVFLVHLSILAGSIGVFGRITQFYHRRADLQTNADVFEHFREKRKPDSHSKSSPSAVKTEVQPQLNSQSQSMFASVFPKSAPDGEPQPQPVLQPQQQTTTKGKVGIFETVLNFPSDFAQHMRDSRAEAEEKWRLDASPPKVAIDTQFDLNKTAAEYVGVSFDILAAGAVEYYSKLQTLDAFKTRFRTEKRYDESLSEKFMRFVHEFFNAPAASHLKVVNRVISEKAV